MEEFENLNKSLTDDYILLSGALHIDLEMKLDKREKNVQAGGKISRAGGDTGGNTERSGIKFSPRKEHVLLCPAMKIRPHIIGNFVKPLKSQSLKYLRLL